MIWAAELSCVTSVRPDPSFRAGRPGRVKWIVIHTAECAETATAGSAVAGYLVSAGRASAHFVVSATETIQQVRLEDTAWAAPGANELGVQIELVGRASQGASEWSDPYSTALLARAAELVALLCDGLAVPARFVAQQELRQGEPGITTHAEVSRAWRRSTHTDPGLHFPLAAFLEDVGARTVLNEAHEDQVTNHPR